MDALPKPTGGMISTETKPAVCEKHGEYEARAMRIGGRILHWSGCPECDAIAAEARRAQEQAAAREMEARRLRERLDRAGIPARYRAKDFGGFAADTDGKERALTAAMEFAANFKAHLKAGTVMVFSGKPGTGKSHLATSIAQALLPEFEVLYLSAIDAVRMVRNTWRRDADQTESAVLERLASVPLLILDEVGVQYGTESEQVTLFDIIDKRYRDMMPLILLTNLNKAGMKSFLGDRSFDRLREGGLWVTFDWDSGRAKVAA